MKNTLGFLLALTTAGSLIAPSCLEVREGCQHTGACNDEPTGGTGGEAGSNMGGDAGAGAAGSSPCGEECADATPLCDEESGACVACLESEHCTDAAAPRCDGGECVGCTEAEDCAHVAGKTLCDEESGACVECTADDESACGDNSCDPVTHTCTTTVRGTVGTCKACLADSECQDGHRCIELDYQEEPHGWYCMPLAPMEGCAVAGSAPWRVGLLNRESRSETAAVNYCGINESLTTCEAVHAALDGEGIGCTSSDDCPTGGICEFVGASGDRCTYLCGNVNQCPSAMDDPDLATCPSSETRYCGLVL